MLAETNFGLSPNHTMEIIQQRGEGGFQAQPQRLVLCGFASKAVDVPFYEVSSEGEAITLFGAGSMLHDMVAAALTAYPAVKLYAYVLGRKLSGLQSSDASSSEDHPETPPSLPSRQDLIFDLGKIPEEQYTQFALPYFDHELLKAFAAELDRRWGTDAQVDGHLFLADQGSVADLKGRYDKSGAIFTNSKHVTVLDTAGSPTSSWKWAAALAAVNARYAATPSRPYSGLTIPGVEVAAEERSRKERDELLAAGVSTLRVRDSRAVIDRLVTTYNRDEATGANDTSYRDVNAKQTLSAIRYDWLSYVNQTFYRHLLSQDETQAGEYVATPRSMLGLAVSRHDLWQAKLLCQDPAKRFAKSVRVEVSDDGSHFITYLPVHLMGQLQGTHTILAFRRGRS